MFINAWETITDDTIRECLARGETSIKTIHTRGALSEYILFHKLGTIYAMIQFKDNLDVSACHGIVRHFSIRGKKDTLGSWEGLNDWKTGYAPIGINLPHEAFFKKSVRNTHLKINKKEIHTKYSFSFTKTVTIATFRNLPKKYVDWEPLIVAGKLRIS